MLQTFDSQYELPGRTYVSQTAIPQLYNSVKDNILKEIKDIPLYSANTDMWSSSNMTPYMSVTIYGPKVLIPVLPVKEYITL